MTKVEQLVGEINSLAAQQQIRLNNVATQQEFNEDGIALEFHDYSDDIGIRLRDRLTQSTLRVVEQPWEQNLEQILVAMRGGKGIVKAVCGEIPVTKKLQLFWFWHVKLPVQNLYYRFFYKVDVDKLPF
jgi:hypothetical protein